MCSARTALQSSLPVSTSSLTKLRPCSRCAVAACRSCCLAAASAVAVVYCLYGALSASQHSSSVHSLPKAADGVAGAPAGDISLTHAGTGKDAAPSFA